MQKTPKEKLQAQADLYAVNLATLKNSPGDPGQRKNLQTIAWRIKNMVKEFRLTAPDLEPLPPLPGQRPAPNFPPAVKGRAAVLPSTVDQVLDQHLPDTASVADELQDRTHTLQDLVDHPGGKAGPGPYVPPTAADLAQALHLDPCGEDCVHPEHHHHHDPAHDQVVARYDDRPRDRPKDRPRLFSEFPRAAAADDLARGIARQFWPLCQALDAMDDREHVRPALDAIHARLQVAYGLLDETSVSTAG